MSSLLVIGSSGFFGKSILDSYRRGLLNSWCIDTIIIIARNAETLRKSNPELISSSVKLLNGDISTCRVIPSADYVIHAAASSDAAKYLISPEAEKKNISAGIYNYCDLARKFHKNSHIVYCSSGAIYGQQPPSMDYLSEDYIGGSTNNIAESKKDYAVAKRDAENAIVNLGKNGLSVSIARCFAFVGPFLPHDKHFAIGNFIQDGLMRRPIIVKGRNQVYRSYMYADNLVHWLIRICENSNSDCPTYNVGSDYAISIADLAYLVARRFDVKVHKAIPAQGNVDRYIPSIAKAKNVFGLDLLIDLDGAIDATIASLRLRNLDD